MAEMLVTITRVREVIGGADLRTDGDLPDALSERVLDLVSGAMERARQNGRATVRPEDVAGPRVSDATELTVATRVQQVIREADLRVDSTLVEAINGHVQAILAEGIERARANGRSTVRPYDLPAIR